MDGEKKVSEGIVPFHFRQCVVISKATGERAATLKQLREKITRASEEALYHHTYQYFLKGHLQEYTNRFAEWVAEAIEERALSERLSNLDPYAFDTIDGLREELIRLINEFLDENPEPGPVRPGAEFYFNETITLVFDAGLRARNLAEFLMALRYLEKGSIYFHFYEARNRGNRMTNDFSEWFADAFQKRDLAEQINRIDPFMYDIEGIRSQLVDCVEAELRRDMEELT